MPCGHERVLAIRPETLGAITFDPKLGFEHGYSHWKALDEQKTMVPSKRGFKMDKEKKILIPHPFKRT
jgi:hypothetical protein